MAIYELNNGERILADLAFIDANFPDATYVGEELAGVTAESWLISVGAFFDRFSDQKWPVLASTNPAVQALVKDCSVRKYIDLQRADLPTALDILIGSGLAVDKAAILSMPCQAGEEPLAS